MNSSSQNITMLDFITPKDNTVRSSGVDFPSKISELVVNKKKNKCKSSLTSLQPKIIKINQNKLDYLAINTIQESKVSKKFSEQTTKRVVLIVLVVVMSEYIFLLTSYVNPVRSYKFALDAIDDLDYTSKYFE